MVCESACLNFIRNTILALIFIANAALIGYGAKIRFSHAGRVCSGDFQKDILPAWGKPITEQEPYLLNMGYFLRSYTVGFGVLYVFFFVLLIAATLLRNSR